MPSRPFPLVIVVLTAMLGAQAALAAPPAATPPKAPAIPRATFIGNMDAEFAKMDANKDGKLTRLEIETFQRAAAIQQIQARNRAVFATLDTDHNGQLSPAEFSRFTATPPQPNAGPMLQKFDSNHDNAISLIEYRATTLANFDKLDTDKDGVVTPAEMRAGGIIK